MMGHVCLPTGMPSHEIEQLDMLVKDRIRVEKGQSLFRQGETLNALFGLRIGSIKTQLDERNGQRQITGFFLTSAI
jgi:CRP/FNR family transcriptional regulator